VTAWIFSTEPDVFPWTQVERDGRARWDGVRGPLARKNLRLLSAGDRVWGYHSSPEKELVCWARVAGPAYPDPADDRWLAVDVEFDRWLKTPVALSELRAHPVLSAMDFVRIPRLSVAPLTGPQEKILMGLSRMVSRHEK
jgi:predicted RNA-binding protein with PUA-like domain